MEGRLNVCVPAVCVRFAEGYLWSDWWRVGRGVTHYNSDSGKVFAVFDRVLRAKEVY